MKGERMLYLKCIYLLLVCFYFFTLTNSLRDFCFITCAVDSCTNSSYNGCNTCSQYFKLSGTAPNTCIFDNNQTQYKLSKITSDFTISPSTSAVCSATHTYFGNYTNATFTTFTTLTAISDPHYAIQLIAWVLMIDRWNGASENVGFNLTSTGQVKTINQNDPNNVTNQKYCGDPNDDTYARFAQQYNQTDAGSPVTFKSVVTNGQGSSWGVKDFYIVAKLCHSFCTACYGPNATQCTNCITNYYLSNTQCASSCLTGYGINSTSYICILCHTYCLTCYNSATNCSTCKNSTTINSTVTTIYTVQGQNRCQIACPAGYFAYSSTKQCLSCSLHCVNLSIVNYLDSSQTFIEFSFTFSQEIDFLSFNYTNFVDLSVSDLSLDLAVNFTITYTLITNFTFKLTITANAGSFFNLSSFCATTKAKNLTSLQFAKNLYQLDTSVYSKSNCINWQILVPVIPEFSIFTEDQQNIYQSLETFNNQMESFTTQKGVQQLIKSGLFALLIPGAQLSSTVLLHSPKIAQNVYEGSRFWGSFIYFDVPPFQQNSVKIKYTFSEAVANIISESKSRNLQQINRKLQTTSFINEWKFQRTGHTGFFILDTYFQLILIFICWVMMGIRWYLDKNKYLISLRRIKIKASLTAIFHKIHEISFFYLILSALIQVKNFQSNYLHIISIMIASIFLTYYLAYQLKIFYDLIEYPNAKIKSKSYYFYLQNYSIFLAYLRFQEYNDKQKWSWRHFLRPYNYQSLSFIKKATMLIGLTIFYQHLLLPIITLTIIQFLDVIRFVLTLPYHSRARNLFYLLLQLTLLAFFICSWINQQASLRIYDSQGVIVDSSYIDTYKNSGWVGMILIFAYNILYILGNLVQILVLICTKNSLLQMMWKNRNQYYEQLYQHYQQYGNYYRLIKNYTQQLKYSNQIKEVKSYKDWVNRLHGAQPILDLSQQKQKVYKNLIERGNIYQTQYKVQQQEEQLEKQVVDVKIETFTIKQFRKIYILDDFNGDIYSQNAPKNVDKYLNHQTKSQENYKTRRPQRKDSQTKSISNQKQKQKQISSSYTNIPSFDIQYRIVPQLIKSSAKKNKKNNFIHYPKVIKNTIRSDQLNVRLQNDLAMSLVSFALPGTICLKLHTYLSVQIKKYEQGQKIPILRENMHQQIQVFANNGKNIISLSKLMHGFPVDWQFLQSIRSKPVSSTIKQ